MSNFYHSMSRQRRLFEIEDWAFTDRRIQFYATGVIVAYTLSFVWRLVHDKWIFLSDGRPRCVDFGWMWLSGKLAVAGVATEIFDYPAFSAAQIAVFGNDNCSFITPFVYPPMYVFIIYPLGIMPYLIAYAAWVMVTLFLYSASVYVIVPRRAAVIAGLSPLFVPVNADFGHNGFLTAALIGFSLITLGRRPQLAGTLVGILTYKPHIGVLFPFALLASRNWRAVITAAATSIILSVAALIAFGPEGWSSLFHTLMNRRSGLSPNAEVPLALHSVFGLLRWAGASSWITWVGHLTAAAVVALTVCALWAKPIPYALKAAVLCIGSVMVSPYILFYDFCILSIAVAFLVRDGMSRGFLPGERTVLLVCWGALFLVMVPIGPLICGVLLFLVARRVVAYRDRMKAFAAAEPVAKARLPFLNGDAGRDR